MRDLLSNLLTQYAQKDPRAIVLSGDHGYALFDQIRKTREHQFLNVGVMEQGMVGLAAGLAKTGLRPIVYGLSSFVPIRVLEQIKLDVCYSKLPVIFLGDGAGLVYSTLGSSHQCGEDLAALRPMPNIKIFSPADKFELEACFNEAIATNGPSYIRLGKSDRPPVHSTALLSTEPVYTRSNSGGKAKTCFVASGSMSSVSLEAARKLGAAHVSVPRIKPFPKNLASQLADFNKVVVIEEHSRYGGLCSALLDAACENGERLPKITSLSLKDQFAEKCGSYQYALSEHDLSDEQLFLRLAELTEI
jgi:transketolase